MRRWKSVGTLLLALANGAVMMTAATGTQALISGVIGALLLVLVGQLWEEDQ